MLILDEPLASLDPLARHDFMGSLMAAVAEDRPLGPVLLPCRLPELERIADYLVVLDKGRLQLAGEVDALLDTHRILTGPGGEMAINVNQFAVVQVRQAGAQWRLLVRTGDPQACSPTAGCPSPPDSPTSSSPTSATPARARCQDPSLRGECRRRRPSRDGGGARRAGPD